MKVTGRSMGSLGGPRTGPGGSLKVPWDSLRGSWGSLGVPETSLGGSEVCLEVAVSVTIRFVMHTMEFVLLCDLPKGYCTH